MKLKYTGEGSIEIAIGNHRAKFTASKPQDVGDDLGYALLERGDFEVVEETESAEITNDDADETPETSKKRGKK